MRYTPAAILLLCCFIFSSGAVAQGWLWGRGNTCSSVDGWAVATDQVGNVFVGGFNTGNQVAAFGTYKLPNTGGGINQCIVAKYDKDGNFLWARGTQQATTYLMGIATDPDNNVIMFGSFSTSFVTIGNITLTKSPAMDVQYFLAKFDPDGNITWAVTAGNAQNNYVHVANICYILSVGAVTTDQLGNIFITANFHKPTITIGGVTLYNTDPSGATDDILIAKYDPAGNVVWAKSAGGNKKDNAYGITATPAGDVYIAGVYASGSVAFGSSVLTNTDTGSQAFIARFDGSGNALWADSSGGTGQEYAIGLASDEANNVYLVGGFKDTVITYSGTAIRNPDSGKAVMYLVKFGTDNNVSWYKVVRSLSDTDAGVWGYSVSVSACNAVWVSGAMTSGAVIDSMNLYAPAYSLEPVFIAGYGLDGHYIGSAALQSGGDDQVGAACDSKGNISVCSDYACNPFTLGSNPFHGILQFDTTENCIDGGELLYVAKYSSLTNGPKNTVVTAKAACFGPALALNAPAGYGTYTWYDSSTTGSHMVTDAGNYWVVCTRDCQDVMADTFKVTVDCDCGKNLYLPNSFTPNGDGKNDVFYPRAGFGLKMIKSFRIYNRWGQLLFEKDNIMANDESNAWDGSFQGNAALPDVYIWVVEALCENDKPVSKKGSVTIIH